MGEEVSINTEEALRHSLALHRIDVSSWGNGGAKTVGDLLSELSERESFLDEVDGSLIRVTSNIAVDVFHDGPSGREVLFEEKQVKRGKEKRRPLGASFAEKIKNDADPETEVWRGFEEELPQLVGHVADLQIGGEPEIEEGPAYSYPGLTTRYLRHRYQATIDDEGYDPNGYITEEQDKTTYFKWKPSE